MTAVPKDPHLLLEVAQADLDDAEFNLQNGRIRVACSSAYDAGFHAAEARIAKEGREAKTHKAVNLIIGEIYRGDELPVQSLLSKMQTRRERSTYGASEQPDEDDAKQSVADARKIIDRVVVDVGPPPPKRQIDPAVLQALRNRGQGFGG